jgi:hypothetical protein
MDAVIYYVGALEKFANMSPTEVLKIGFEIAILRTKGIDVNNPSKQIPCEVRREHSAVCICYVYNMLRLNKSCLSRIMDWICSQSIG